MKIKTQQTIWFHFHYGWVRAIVSNPTSIRNSAYRAILQKHDFLTPDNHSVKYGTHEDGDKYISIVKNRKSPKSIAAPWWHEDGPGTTWFSETYYTRKPQHADHVAETIAVK